MKNISLWTALVTPLYSDGSIHFTDLKNLIGRQEKAGNGVLLAGSTGEGLALSESEKKEIINFVSGLNVQVPIMAGVGGFNLSSQAEWITWCNQTTIDSFLLVNPLYAKPGSKGQIKWFTFLLDAATKPCMIYNIPSRTGSKIHPEVIKAIKDHPNFWSVKEASGSINDYREFRETVPDVPFYSGDDALMAHFSVLGSHGLVSVAANVWPEATKLYVKKCLNRETQSLFPLWNNAVDELFSAPNPIPVKRLLKEKGLIEFSALRAPLTEDELNSTENLLEADKAIINWYNLNK